MNGESDAVSENVAFLEALVKSRIVKLVLTLGTIATALMAGAANFKVG